MTVVDIVKKTYVDAQDKKFGLPTVADAADRLTQFPVPLENQRVHNLATHAIEGYSAGAWKNLFGYPILVGEVGVQDASYPYGDVRRYGAIANGVFDNTAVFNAAITSMSVVFGGGAVTVPSAALPYMINPNFIGGFSIRLLSNVSLVLGRGATLKAITTAGGAYAVVLAMNVSNVAVYGGIILGERTTHVDTGGEWGHCIQFGQVTDGLIEGTVCKDAWGDGVYIGPYYDPITAAYIAATPCLRVTARGLRTDNARRNGCSVTASRHAKFESCHFNNTVGVGTLQAGIDIEVDVGQVAEDTDIVDCTAEGNGVYGFLMTAGDGCRITTCRAKNNGSFGGVVGQSFTRCEVDGLTVVCNSATQYGWVCAASSVGSDVRGLRVTGTHHAGYAINGPGIGGHRLSGFRIEGVMTNGVVLDAQADNNTISDGEIVGAISDGLLINLGSGNEVIDVRSRANGRHGALANGSRNAFSGGKYESNVQDGVKLDTGSYGSVIRVRTRLNGTNGIELASMDDSEVMYCKAIENSQTADSASFGIRLTTAGNRNTIAHNEVRKGATANKHGHGINVSAAGVNTTRIFDNDTTTGGNVREINDVGTDTIMENKPAVVVLAYAVSMIPQPFAGIYQQITVTDAVAFAIANPQDNANNVLFKGLRLEFEIFNNTAGAHGAITFGANYQTQGALVIATTKRRKISFVCNGTKWVEQYRSAADI